MHVIHTLYQRSIIIVMLLVLSLFGCSSSSGAADSNVLKLQTQMAELERQNTESRQTAVAAAQQAVAAANMAATAVLLSNRPIATPVYPSAVQVPLGSAVMISYTDLDGASRSVVFPISAVNAFSDRISNSVVESWVILSLSPPGEGRDRSQDLYFTLDMLPNAARKEGEDKFVATNVIGKFEMLRISADLGFDSGNSGVSLRNMELDQSEQSMLLSLLPSRKKGDETIFYSMQSFNRFYMSTQDFLLLLPNGDGAYEAFIHDVSTSGPDGTDVLTLPRCKICFMTLCASYCRS